MPFSPRVAVIGSGPNGLTAAARLATEGWKVDVYERSSTPGGAAASSNHIFANSIVDLGAAGHPFGVASSAFQKLDLESFGLKWLNATYEMAHPLDNGETGLLSKSLDKTAEELGQDARPWTKLHAPIVKHIDKHLDNLLSPIYKWPKHPAHLISFGIPSVLPASSLGRALFSTEKARALFAGSSVHAITSPNGPFTSAFGMIFGSLGMSRGWPVAEGGTQSVVNSLLAVIKAHDGNIHTGCEVDDIRAFSNFDAIVLNLTPHQVLKLKGLPVDVQQRRKLRRWKHGTAVFKVDFLLNAPVPWKDPRVNQAGTVHVGGTVDEICVAEDEVTKGRLPDRPFVMVCQQYVADPSRGMTLWTYAHVPHGFKEQSPGQVRRLIIQQIERFAPNFRDTVIDFHETSPAELEAWNPNLIGGDLAGGSMHGRQLLARPSMTLHPHRLSSGIYLASGATPPGAGVHGLPGWWAAEEALREF